MNSQKRPNIIFIMTDQQRFDTFGCINPEIKTPNFDNIIKDSILFRNAYCSNPSCIPSRAGIMTGKFPSECGAPSFITPLPKEEITFMSRLQEAGYYTAVIGKQHFAGSEIEKGYDYENIIDCHFANPGNKEAEGFNAYLSEQGLDITNVMTRDLISGGSWNIDIKYHLDNYIGDLGKEWIDKKLSTNDKKPWFFTLSFPGPHHPYDCEGTKYSDLYNLEDLSVPETTYKDLDQKPNHFKEMDAYAHIYTKDFTREQYLKTKRSYYANMSLIDDKVGQVIELLKEKNAYDDTLIIFSTDHGDFMGDFGMVEKLQCLTDSLMRVPLFVKPPIKGFKGSVVEDLVTNIDIASTCLTTAGYDIPEELSNYPYNSYWDSSIQAKIRSSLYMEARDLRGIVKDGIKTVFYIDREYGELYDMNKDPLERDNQWNNKDYDSTKLEAYKLLINQMYKATPEWNTPWNHGTPTI